MASSSTRDNVGNTQLDTGKYVRYTPEQLDVLEKLYTECPKPSSMRRQELITGSPVLCNVEPKHIKVWFQNRRCRDKLKKESTRLQSVNRKLNAMNKLLIEENDHLQQQVSQLLYENGFMHKQMQTGPKTGIATSCESVVSTSQHQLRNVNNTAGLLKIAEETLAEFIPKARGTAVDWVQMPGMKPGPDLTGTIPISPRCRGVAARACGLVNLEPAKIAEILKDRPSWFRDCRSLEVFTMFRARNGGTIELIYMQMFGPTILAPARDFWILRYTTCLEDGSLVICERSLSDPGTVPDGSASQFVRAQMLPSGYLIRPCEGGRSIIHIVDHLDLEPCSVPEVLRPLYQSSKVVAQEMTIAALHYIRQIAKESCGEVVYTLGRQPAVFRSFSNRLLRGFNDAINGFIDDGWSLLGGDGVTDVVVSINSSRNMCSRVGLGNSLLVSGGVLCAKASMLLQNVSPALLVRFLREHRSEWADYNIDAYSAISLKAGLYSAMGSRPVRFSGRQIIMPLVHTVEHEEFLEVIRLEGHASTEEQKIVSRDIHLLQLCRGLDEDAVGVFSDLVFAPVDEWFSDDAPLLSSGLRVIRLDSETGDVRTQPTLDLASSLEAGSSMNQTSGDASRDAPNHRSVLTIAFQLPYQIHHQDSVANMARQYVRSVISSVQRVATAITPSQRGSYVGQELLPRSPEALTLARWICQSYSNQFGAELLKSDGQVDDSVLKLLWNHSDAILCCSLKSRPHFTFANQAGLNMLETTLVALQDITPGKIFDESGRKVFYSEFCKIVQQGFVCLPMGVCLSTMGRPVSYEQVLIWKVLGEDSSLHCLALTFINWFLP